MDVATTATNLLVSSSMYISDEKCSSLGRFVEEIGFVIIVSFSFALVFVNIVQLALQRMQMIILLQPTTVAAMISCLFHC